MVTANSISHSLPPRAAAPGPLSSLELGWAKAAFAGVFPSGAVPSLPGIEETDFASSLQALVKAAPPRAALGLRIALALSALAPLFVLGRFCTLARVDARGRTIVMRALLASSLYPIRQLAMLLKMVGALIIARVPQVRAAMLAQRSVPVPAESGTRLIDGAELVRPRRPALVVVKSPGDDHGRRSA